MNTRCIASERASTNRAWLSIWMLTLAATLLAWTASHAEERRPRVRDMHYDTQFSHNRYYHSPGYSVVGAPHGAYEIRHRDSHYWYHGGEWYRPRGRFSVVVAAPIGAFVPVLPPYYSTVWWRGAPYYYADNTYYSWDAGQRQYEVVDAPVGIDSGASTAAPAAEEVFIYPKNGQTAEQQESDRYECHRFAVQQTGYDPTLAGGGVQADASVSKRSDYLRAQAACLEARGYSVK